MFSNEINLLKPDELIVFDEIMSVFIFNFEFDSIYFVGVHFVSWFVFQSFNRIKA